MKKEYLIEIKTVEELEKIVQENKLVVLKFGAEWCGPCKILKPILEKLSNDMDNVLFTEVNVDESSEISETFGVMNIPTTIILKDGEQVERLIGLQTENNLRKKIENYISC